MAKEHPGFKSVQSSIAAKEGVSKDRAGAILAASTRRASPAARKANPHLNRVKGYDGIIQREKAELAAHQAKIPKFGK
jgi:hypothetical protein